MGHRVEKRAVVRDEENGSGKVLERCFERLATLQVEMVRGLVEDEEVRARRDEDREREPRRSPPDSAVTGFSCASQPEKRKRPRSDWARGRVRPVMVCMQSSTLPRSSRCTSCWGK